MENNSSHVYLFKFNVFDAFETLDPEQLIIWHFIVYEALKYTDPDKDRQWQIEKNIRTDIWEWKNAARTILMCAITLHLNPFAFEFFFLN